MKFKHILAISAATFLACQWTLPAVAQVAPQEAIEGESDAPRSVFTQKYCSYFVAGNWRDVVLVPDTWNARNCERLEKAMGANQFVVACMGDFGAFSFGRSFASNPGVNNLPSANSCGWTL
jgi:hypothetical protein